MKQMEMAVFTDIVISCVGGATCRVAFPSSRINYPARRKTYRSSPSSRPAPSLTGLYAYDFGDVAGMAPIESLQVMTSYPFMPEALRYRHGTTGQPFTQAEHHRSQTVPQLATARPVLPSRGQRASSARLKPTTLSG
jgi:hypothetical protein